ncbi:hypothetical protein [Escherichia coli]|uniref:hypothetical protein n=1 Tax=Escherichia coli TaxID=562 RepID=UPI0038B4138F
MDKNEVKQNITTIDVGQSGLFHDFNGKIAHLYDDHYFTEDSSPNNLEDIKNSDFNGKLYGGDDFEGVTIKRSDFKKDPLGEDDFEGVTIKRSDFKKDPLGEYDFEGVMIKRSDFKKDPHGEDDFEREHCGNVINHDDYKPNNITDIITNNILDELKIKCKKISEKSKSVDFLFKVIDDILPNNIVGRYILYEIICTGSQRYRHMTTEMDKIFSEVNNVVSYHLSNHIAHPRLNKKGIENIEQLLLKNQISKKDKNQVLFELSQVFITLSSSLYLGNEDLSVTPLRMYAAALLNYAFKNYSRGESLDTNSLQNKMSGYYDRSLRSDCCAQVLSRDMKINIRELDKVFFELPESFYPETWWHNNL